MILHVGMLFVTVMVSVGRFQYSPMLPQLLRRIYVIVFEISLTWVITYRAIGFSEGIWHVSKSESEGRSAEGFICTILVWRFTLWDVFFHAECYNCFLFLRVSMDDKRNSLDYKNITKLKTDGWIRCWRKSLEIWESPEIRMEP